MCTFAKKERLVKELQFEKIYNFEKPVLPGLWQVTVQLGYGQS